ncbi:hypothetical protein B0A50_01907 [Salinomyces thailandicus]|uniref:Nucleolar protein 12 n=1 Tax=Salinomyces thailandicus TaxID=706561 RepID=A0A4U0U9E0_9PEZI|nr:hypothetical protein B0A50_01907 [Salinomyces thailandica]
MATSSKEDKKAKKADKVEKKSKGTDKKEKKHQSHGKNGAAQTALSLLADEKSFDPGLSSLFSRPAPVQPIAQPVEDSADEEVVDEIGGDDDISEDEAADLDNVAIEDLQDGDTTSADVDGLRQEELRVSEPRRKRKHKDADEQLEDAYMDRLAREEAKDAERLAAERASKRQKPDASVNEDVSDAVEEAEGDSEKDAIEESDEDAASPPPKHETQQAADDELAKAGRTVFVGNVSTEAISSKSARKSLMQHLGSFITEAKRGEPPAKVESIRFRSTPYSSAIPKKASYAKKELMDATTKSTNAYVVYSSPQLSREAARHLNGTMVLNRHIRVDEIAHPAKVDHRRCVFVGNLGFVDDETNVQQANREDGREDRKPGKHPADIEEGLWRTFGKCGKVESVRVIRDSTTRVGKGIAYVQFDDENGVEAALLLNEKKFPPMLPRKLRVSRARAQKKNAKPGSGRPGAPKPATGYQRKVTSEEASQMGRAGKLYGRAAAAKMKKPGVPERRAPSSEGATKLGAGIRAPESFVFEGHRASSKSGKPGMKSGARKAAKGKPTSRSAKRGAAYKAGKNKAGN